MKFKGYSTFTNIDKYIAPWRLYVETSNYSFKVWIPISVSTLWSLNLIVFSKSEIIAGEEFKIDLTFA